jgi:hypothetical protein
MGEEGARGRPGLMSGFLRLFYILSHSSAADMIKLTAASKQGSHGLARALQICQKLWTREMSYDSASR